MIITKSDFLTYLDSPLHFWALKYSQLDPYQPDLYQQHLSRQGYQVQKLAQEFLRRKVETEYPNAELTFEYTVTDGDFEARIDALVHDKLHDTYDIYEIKSSTRLKKEHKYDVAFQYLIAKPNINLHKVYLVRVNKDYIQNQHFDLQTFFVIEDMMKHIEKIQEEVLELRQYAIDTIISKDPPSKYHCYKPQDCHCQNLCHPNLNEYPIYDLTRGSKKQYQALLENQIHDLASIPDDFNLRPVQKLQCQSIKEDQPIINHEALQKELDQLEYPLYFLDYETFGTALPLHNGYKPFQDIIFQYSLHVVNDPNQEPEHHECLITDSSEPSLHIINHLKTYIQDSGTIIVWNKSFECGRNKELALLQPEFADYMESINSRTYDLMDPFKKGYYVDYRFHGSSSIKKVLPILAPELNYKELEIGEGTAAMMSWYELVYGAPSEEQKQNIIKNLKSYCELDTYAMVVIWQFLSDTCVDTK